MRTLRIGVLNLSLTIGVSFGISLSGIIYQKLGFYGVYSLCTTMYLMSVIYGILYVKDIKAPAVCHDNKTPAAVKPSVYRNVREFFDLKHLQNAFRVTFKKGDDNRRIRIIMMMLVLVIIMGPMTGQYNTI